MKHLTIQGDQKLEGKKWKRLDSFSDGKNILLLEQIQDDEIKVGDRVVCQWDDTEDISEDMVYRAEEVNENNIKILDDWRDTGWYDKSKFTKLQKPKVGDKWWALCKDGSIIGSIWDNYDYDNQVWDFGFGFHTEEQAEFCRDRVRRVI